ncbi:hypothetical protein AAHH80_39490, partial [Burkholderia pseudomallei]
TETLRYPQAPVVGADERGALDHDVSKYGAKNGVPLGERFVVSGRGLDEGGKAGGYSLVGVWPANAAGRWGTPVEVRVG